MKYKICTKYKTEADCYLTNNPIKYYLVKLKILLGIVNEWK